MEARGGLPEAIRVSIMFPAGRFRLQDSNTDADNSGITMFTSYSMYLKNSNTSRRMQTQNTKHNITVLVSRSKRSMAITTQKQTRARAPRQEETQQLVQEYCCSTEGKFFFAFFSHRDVNAFVSLSRQGPGVDSQRTQGVRYVSMIPVSVKTLIRQQ